MVALPAETAVTRPEALTVATLVFDDVHVTFLSVALDGVILAVSCAVCPVSNVWLVGPTDTPVTYTVDVELLDLRL